MTKTADWFTHITLVVSGGIEPLAVILVSMTPLIELRGGIPIGLKLGMSMWEAFGWAFLGSSLICVPLLLILKPIFSWLRKKKSVSQFFARIENIFKKKAHINNPTDDDKKHSERMKTLGVFVFSLLPIPGAGVWTASIIAVLLEVKFGWAILSIVGGNLIDGLIMLGLTALIGKQNLDYLLLVLFFLILVVVFRFIYGLLKQNPETTSRTSDKAD